MHMDKSLVTIKSLSERSGLPVRTIRTLMSQRKIPYIRAGHRTVLFSLEKVMAAIERFEVKAVA
jgi:excisionase family DNA binding protein